MTIKFPAANDPLVTLRTLSALNMEEMLWAFKLQSSGAVVRWLASQGLAGLVENLSHTVVRYDAAVGQQGLSAASDWLLGEVTGSVTATGLEHIPQGKPLLVVSNHPGLTDAMVIFATLRRDDLKIIAADRGLLRLLPHIEQHLIYVSDAPDQRLASVREVTRQLRAGVPVLTFPYGGIERDPALYPAAVDTLPQWSRSIEVFARFVPDLQILPVMVAGVLSVDALRNPISRMYRTTENRDWAAASLQFLLRRYRDVAIRIEYGQPLNGDTPDLHAAVVTQMRAMMQTRA